MVRQTARVIFLEIVAGLVILSILAMAALAIRLSSGPLELSLFKNDIVSALERMRGGREVSLDTISLEWVADENRAVIVASDLKFFNDGGALSAEAARAEILVDTGGVFLGKVRPVGLALNEGWIGVEQSSAGWKIAGDPVSTVSDTDAPERTADDILQLLNTGLIDLLTLLRTDSQRVTLKTVRFEGFDIILMDEAQTERTRLVGASGNLLRGRGGITLNVRGNSLGGEEAPGGLEIAMKAGPDYHEIEAEITLEETSLSAVAAAAPDMGMVITGLPADVTFRAAANDETGLQRLSLSANAGAGQVRFRDQELDIRQINLVSEYRPTEDVLSMELNEFDLGTARGAITLSLEDALRKDGPRRFSLNAPRLQIDLRPTFSDIWPFQRVSAKGQVNLQALELDLETLSARMQEAELRASGLLGVLQERGEGDAPLKANMVAEVTGRLEPEHVLWFWPVEQAPGARGYVSRNVLAANVSSATARVAMGRGTFREGYLADDALKVTFEASEAAVKPLPDIPQLSGASLVGNMTGNSFRIDFTGGRLEQWRIGGGSVHYPQLNPAGADMIISINGEGPAENLVRMVSDSRLQLQARTGFDPGNISGTAEMAFSLTRPALPDVPVSDFRYQGEGLVKGGGLAKAFNGLSLTESDARISLDETGIQITGFGQLVESPLQYDWSYAFGGENTLARLKANGLINPDILNAFGVVGRAYLTGEAPIELDARLAGTNIRSLDAAIDLLGSRLDVAELGWVKPQGEAASATVRYDVGDGVATTIATLDAETAEFDGTFTLEPNGRLISANVQRAYLEGRADFSGTAQRTEDDGLLFRMESPFLDLSRVMGNMPSFGDGPSPVAGRMGDLSLSANIEQLIWREGFDTTSTRLSLISSRDGLQTMEAVGKLPNGADVSAAFDASGLGDPSFLINSGDASFLASVFLGTDALEGGTLQMTGTLATGDLPTQIRMVIENGRLKEAPFVTQVLSLASIRGLSDTLAGEGVLFSTIELPLTIAGGRYNVVGARASGPALGLTANGWVTPATGSINIDGVLVPSFGLNSALGGIPGIGKLFISREGEGVISLRYDIEGTFERAQVSVNPLSAITPGVLRRIFENPADEDILDLEDGNEEAEP